MIIEITGGYTVSVLAEWQTDLSNPFHSAAMLADVLYCPTTVHCCTTWPNNGLSFGWLTAALHVLRDHCGQTATIVLLVVDTTRDIIVIEPKTSQQVV